MRPRHAGITLPELVLVLTIGVLLATIAMIVQGEYLVRARSAQVQIDIDRIRSVIRSESRGSRGGELHLGAQPGAVPPRLARLLPERTFQGLHGLQLWLIRAPEHSFPAWPNDPTYALVALATEPAAHAYLAALHALLPQSGDDKPWIAPNAFVFPLDSAPGDSATTGVPPTPGHGCSRWETADSRRVGGQWLASANALVCGSDGLPLNVVSAALKIRVVQEVRTANGQNIERDWTTQGNINSGRISFSQGGMPLSREGQEGVTALRFEILEVAYYTPANPAMKWDGVAATVRIPAP